MSARNTPSDALRHIAENEGSLTLTEFLSDFEPVGVSIWNGLLLCKYVRTDGDIVRLTDDGMWKHAQIQAGKTASC